MKELPTQLDHTSTFDSISPSAMSCARIRAEYTRMPYATGIYWSALVCGANLRGLAVEENLPELMQNRGFATRMSMLEGRHLAMHDAILGLGNASILELSAGLSSHGLELAPKYFYYETDLPRVIGIKQQIVAPLTGCLNGSYHLRPLNFLVREDLSSLVEELSTRKNPVAITHEGVMFYLTTAEQECMRDNIAYTLTTHSPQGCWITTDFSAEPLAGENVVTSSYAEVERETGRKFNRFENDAHVHSFLGEGGLKGKPLDNLHLLSKLTCCDLMRITLDDVRSKMRSCRAWKVTLQQEC